MRADSRATRPRSCEMASTAASSRAATSASSPSTSASVVASRPVVGSSRIRSLGLASSAMAITTRCRCPPESWCGQRRPTSGGSRTRGERRGDLGLVARGLAELATDAHHGVQRRGRVLVDHGGRPAPQPAQRGLGGAHDLPAVHLDRPPGPAARRQVAHRGVGDGGLSRAALAHEPVGLARRQRQVEAADDGVRAVADAEPPDPQGGRHRRSPSARRLQATTTEVTATAGSSVMCGQVERKLMPSTTIPPQSGVGGGRPRPRKPSVPTRITV